MTDSTQPEAGGKMMRPSISVFRAIGGEGEPMRTGVLWRTLLWGEWYGHGRLVLFFILAWLVLVWALPVVAHPGWILAVAPLYALIAGPAFGGTDVLEGSEEYVLTLPATPGQRYAARLLVGGGTLVALTALDLLALGLDLSQMITRFYLEAGLMKPLQINQPGLLYALVALLPIVVFSVAFVVSALSASRWSVLSSGLWGGLAGLALLWAGCHYEQLVWGHFNGFVACPLLAALSAGSLLVGGRMYRRKELGPCAPRVPLPGYWWLWAPALLAALVAGAGLLSWFVRQLTALMFAG